MIEILMLHRVLPQELIKSSDAYFIRGTLISTKRLEELILKYLNDGFTFTTLRESNFLGKEKQAVLTFDDGYTDNYLYAKPILDKYQLKASFYPIIGYCKEQRLAPLDLYYHYVNSSIDDLELKKDWIKGKQKKDFIKLKIQEQQSFVNSLNSPNCNYSVAYMSVKQLQTLHQSGHEIGGHSYYHDIYPLLYRNEILIDIQRTKQAFANIGIELSSYAYTDGQYNQSCIEALQREGISFACAIKSLNLQAHKHYELERKLVREYDIV